MQLSFLTSKLRFAANSSDRFWNCAHLKYSLIALISSLRTSRGAILFADEINVRNVLELIIYRTWLWCLFWFGSKILLKCTKPLIGWLHLTIVIVNLNFFRVSRIDWAKCLDPRSWKRPPVTFSLTRPRNMPRLWC